MSFVIVILLNEHISWALLPRKSSLLVLKFFKAGTARIGRGPKCRLDHRKLIMAVTSGLLLAQLELGAIVVHHRHRGLIPESRGLFTLSESQEDFVLDLL